MLPKTLLCLVANVYRDMTIRPNIEDFMRQKKMMGYHVILKYMETPEFNNLQEVIRREYIINKIGYCILFGNEKEMPGKVMTYGQEVAMSDQILALFDNKLPDIILGRISSGESYDIENKYRNISTQIQKTIEYENYLGSNDWIKQIITVASSEGKGIGDNGESDYEHMHVISEKFSEIDYATSAYYDGTHYTNVSDQTTLDDDAIGNPTASEIKAGIDNGASLVFYAGHATETSWTTSNFDTVDIFNLRNNEKYPVVITVGCSTGSFDENNVCFTEALMMARHNDRPIGSIVTMGSTVLQQWTPPMKAQDAMVDNIIQFLEKKNDYNIGQIFYLGMQSMVEKYGDYGTNESLFWHLFGDPTVQIKQPLQIDEPFALLRQYPPEKTVLKNNGENLILVFNTNLRLIQNNIVVTTKLNQVVVISLQIEKNILYGQTLDDVDVIHESSIDMGDYIETADGKKVSWILNISIEPNKPMVLLNIESSGQYFDINSDIIISFSHNIQLTGSGSIDFYEVVNNAAVDNRNNILLTTIDNSDDLTIDGNILTIKNKSFKSVLSSLECNYVLEFVDFIYHESIEEPFNIIIEFRTSNVHPVINNMILQNNEAVLYFSTKVFTIDNPTSLGLISNQEYDDYQITDFGIRGNQVTFSYKSNKGLNTIKLLGNVIADKNGIFFPGDELQFSVEQDFGYYKLMMYAILTTLLMLVIQMIKYIYYFLRVINNPSR